MPAVAEITPRESKFTSFEAAVNCPELEGFITSPILDSVVTHMTVIRSAYQQAVTTIGKPASIGEYRNLSRDEQQAVQRSVGSILGEEIGLDGVVTMFREDARTRFEMTLGRYLEQPPGTGVTNLHLKAISIQTQTSNRGEYCTFLDNWEQPTKMVLLQEVLHGEMQRVSENLTTESNLLKPDTKKITAMQKQLANLTSVQSRLPILPPPPQPK